MEGEVAQFQYPELIDLCFLREVVEKSSCKTELKVLTIGSWNMFPAANFH